MQVSTRHVRHGRTVYSILVVLTKRSRSLWPADHKTIISYLQRVVREGAETGTLLYQYADEEPPQKHINQTLSERPESAVPRTEWDHLFSALKTDLSDINQVPPVRTIMGVPSAATAEAKMTMKIWGGYLVRRQVPVRLMSFTKVSVEEEKSSDKLKTHHSSEIWINLSA